MSTQTQRICPHLPEVAADMSHRSLTGVKKDSPEFYFNALQYGHYLWQTGHAGRALLAVTRALYADVMEGDPILKTWPLPYAALLWIATHHEKEDFPGNPRVSFQHQATRLRGPRRELRRARAWAVWALIRQAKPGLPGDANDSVKEPTEEEIALLLNAHGHENEAKLWSKLVRSDLP